MTEQAAETPQDAITQVQDTMPERDPTATLLEEIRDESGRQKYQDVQTALKALKASQDYIPSLKSELETLKEKAEMYNEVKTVEQLLSQAQQEQAPSLSDKTEAQATPAPEAVQSEEMSLEEKFKQFLQKEKAQEQASSNYNQVQQQLAEAYGEKQSEVYEQKARELGVNRDFLDEMARRSPKAVLEYFKPSKSQAGVSMSSTMNTSAQPAPVREKPKNVMYGATRDELKAAWGACRPE